MEEIWKDVVGYEELYQVSNLGNVKSLFRYKKNLKPQKDIHGYLKVGLYKNGKCKLFNIHKLVANAFIENPKNYKYVNHKDGNKLNNKVENLEWATRKEQIKHMHEILGVPYADCSKLVQRRWNNGTLGA